MKRNKRNLKAISALALALALGLSGCSSPAGTEAAGEDGGEEPIENGAETDIDGISAPASIEIARPRRYWQWESTTRWV